MKSKLNINKLVASFVMLSIFVSNVAPLVASAQEFDFGGWDGGYSSVDTSGWDNSSSVDTSGWNNSSSVDTSGWDGGYSSVDTSGWNSSSVDTSGWNNSSSVDTSGWNSNPYTSVDTSGWNSSSVDTSGWNNSSSVDTSGWNSNPYTSVDTSGWNSSSVDTSGWNNSSSVDTSGWNSNPYTSVDTSGWNSSSVDTSGWNNSSSVDTSGWNSNPYTSVDTSGWNSSSVDTSGWNNSSSVNTSGWSNQNSYTPTYTNPTYPTYSTPSYPAQQTQAYQAPRVSTPSYSTPSYSQPQQVRASTPTYSTPVYQAPRTTTPTYIAQGGLTPIYVSTPTYNNPTTPTYVPQCSVTISAASNNISNGGSTSITWSSTNATSVSLNGGLFNNAKVAASGTYTVKPTSSTTFTVNCFGQNGSSNSASVYINVGNTNYNNYCTNGATNYPSCNNNNVVWCNGVQYYSGYVCPTNNTQTLYVSTTGSSPYQSTASIYGYVNSYGNSAVIWFDYGTSQNNLSWQTSKQYTTNAGQFTGQLTNLQCGTRYYYRAAAQTNYDTKYGEVLSFVTSNCYNNNYYSNNSSVVTRLATAVGTTYAQLNGAYIDGGNSSQCVSFFDYGTDYNLSTRTSNQNLYSQYTTNYFSRAVYNLTPNTTYYYRAGATCNDGVKYGNIYSFKTDGYKVSYTKGGKKTYTTTKTTIIPKTEVTETAKCTCDTEQYLNLLINGLEGESTVGKTANYRVTYKNISNYSLDNVVIKVVLPEELTVSSSDRGQFKKGGKTVTYTIPSLGSLEEANFVVTANVANDVAVGSDIVVNAQADYSVHGLVKKGVKVSGQETAYFVSIAGNGSQTTIDNPNTTNNTNTSSGLFGWIPSNIFDWIVFFVVAMIFLVALRYLFAAFQNGGQRN